MLLELTVAEQRFNAVMEVIRDGLTVTEVADRYGVSRQTVHGWLRRYRSGGLEALADRSHRPDSCPHQMPAVVEARICELRRHHPGWQHWGGGETRSPARLPQRCLLERVSAGSPAIPQNQSLPLVPVTLPW